MPGSRGLFSLHVDERYVSSPKEEEGKEGKDGKEGEVGEEDEGGKSDEIPEAGTHDDDDTSKIEEEKEEANDETKTAIETETEIETEIETNEVNVERVEIKLKKEKKEEKTTAVVREEKQMRLLFRRKFIQWRITDVADELHNGVSPPPKERRFSSLMGGGGGEAGRGRGGGKGAGGSGGGGGNKEKDLASQPKGGHDLRVLSGSSSDGDAMGLQTTNCMIYRFEWTEEMFSTAMNRMKFIL